MPFRISIITATYNRRDHIARCIESVAGQSYPDKEHIIVDGGSTDGTVDLLKEYASRYPHIRWISEPDNGISDAFNKGIAMMTGDAFGIIGDDDYYEPEFFDVVAAEFARHPESGVVSGNCAFIRNDGEIWMTQRASFSGRRDLIECWNHWGKGATLPAPSTFIRRQVVERVGGFDVADRYAMDYHHWIKITEHFPVHTIDRHLANFRFDQGSVSHTQMRRQWDETVAISRRYWGPAGSASYYGMLLSYSLFRLRTALRRIATRAIEPIDAQQRRARRVVARLLSGGPLVPKEGR
jgi:glycosyltransferase involved in cell wall biosynthesis